MALDIKAEIEKLVDKIQDDPKLMEQFKTEPIKEVEKLLGVDLPDDVIEKIVAGVKAKLSVDKLSDAAGLLKKLF